MEKGYQVQCFCEKSSSSNVYYYALASSCLVAEGIFVAVRLTVLGNLTVDEIGDNEGVHAAPGGSAYYVSRTAAYLGARVRLVSMIGRDYPETILRKLGSEGVDLGDVKIGSGLSTR